MQQIISGAAMRMNSIEISDLVGSRHDSVKRTVERLAEGGVISLPPLVEVKTQRERRRNLSSPIGGIPQTSRKLNTNPPHGGFFSPTTSPS